jgi:hypothetical protein
VEGYCKIKSIGLTDRCAKKVPGSTVRSRNNRRGKKSENARRISACLDAVLKACSAQEYFWLWLDILIIIHGHAISQEVVVALN